MARIIVVDTETSGLEPSMHSVVEVAWVNVEVAEGGFAVRPFTYGSTLVRYDGEMECAARATHHIAPEALASPDVPTRDDVVSALVSMEEPGTWFAAHNAPFDHGFLPEVNGPWICTWRCARHHWGDAPGYGNQVLRYYLNLTPETPPDLYPHRALYDALTTAELVDLLLRFYDPAELADLSTKPVRLKLMYFGKYYGQEWISCPTNYLQWILSSDFKDPDVRHTAYEILKERSVKETRAMADIREGGGVKLVPHES